MPASKFRTDLVDVYVFRRAEDGPQFLQLLRTKGEMSETWQPVMGHAESWETSVQCALRELEEETGLKRDSEQFKGFWALNRVHPFYMASVDAIVMSPCFAAEVDAEWTPTLNAEHSMIRWIPLEAVAASFMWPGQRAAIREVETEILLPGSLSRDQLRIDQRGVKR